MTISNLSLTQIPAFLPIVMKLLCVSLSRCLLLYVFFSVTGPVSVPISMYKSLSVCLPSVRPSAVCFFVFLRQSLCKPLSLSCSTASEVCDATVQMLPCIYFKFHTSSLPPTSPSFSIRLLFSFLPTRPPLSLSPPPCFSLKLCLLVRVSVAVSVYASVAFFP